MDRSTVLTRVAYLAAPALFIATLYLSPPSGMPLAAWQVAGLALWMAGWWATEAIPIPATALLPLIVGPVLGLVEMGELAPSYAHPVIFLFLGGFVLGVALQRWGLHRRMALAILRRTGSEARAQVGGVMAASAFLSMWVSNTATCVLMLPITLSLLSQYQQTENTAALANLRRAMLLGLAYSASLGGMATLIGTPPNALLAAYLQENHAITLGFARWMLLALPISLVMLVFVWWWLCRCPLPRQRTAVVNTMEKLSAAEKRVLSVFVLTAISWIFQPQLSRWLPGISDASIALLAALALFSLPSGEKGERLLSWSDAERLPWGVLLLFGGGLALAGLIKSSGLALWIAGNLGQLVNLPVLVGVLGIVAVMVFLTEVSSNTATTAAFLPLMGALAVAQGASPMLYASGELRIGDMVRTGLVINLVAIPVLGIIFWALMRVTFG